MVFAVAVDLSHAQASLVLQTIPGSMLTTSRWNGEIHQTSVFRCLWTTYVRKPVFFGKGILRVRRPLRDERLSFPYLWVPWINYALFLLMGFTVGTLILLTSGTAQVFHVSKQHKKYSSFQNMSTSAKTSIQFPHIFVCMSVCVIARARTRASDRVNACVRACVCARACVCV